MWTFYMDIYIQVLGNVSKLRLKKPLVTIHYHRFITQSEFNRRYRSQQQGVDVKFTVTIQTISKSFLIISLPHVPLMMSPLYCLFKTYSI